MDDDAHASPRRRPTRRDSTGRSIDARASSVATDASRVSRVVDCRLSSPPSLRCARDKKYKKTPESCILSKKSPIGAHSPSGRREGAREGDGDRRDARARHRDRALDDAALDDIMVAADVAAGARTSLESSDAPRGVETIAGFDRAHPRRSDPVALIDARELSAREQMVAVERAKLLRERVVACYRTEGVNHLEKCKGHVKAYLASVKNVGTHAINAGEHDR